MALQTFRLSNAAGAASSGQVPLPPDVKQLNLSRFYAIAQVEYCRNFVFKRNFPIHKLFERSCELGLWQLTAAIGRDY